MKTSPLRFGLCALALSCSWVVGCAGDDDDGMSDSTGGSSSTGSSSSTGGSSTGGSSTGGSSTGGSSTGGEPGTGGTDNGPCPSRVIVTWNEGGEEHHASTVLTNNVGDVVVFNAVACEDDKQVIFRFLPAPLVPMTYQLRYHLLGETGDVEPAASYATDEDGSYATNADHTGELVITEVDEDAQTFSGTFHFEAIDMLAGDDNVSTVTVTDGTITDAPLGGGFTTE
jgi:hypothetical protein